MKPWAATFMIATLLLLIASRSTYRYLKNKQAHKSFSYLFVATTILFSREM